MFTGLIEEKGLLSNILKKEDSLILTIQVTGDFFSSLSLGDSIACNGICLSVTKLFADIKSFSVCVVEETIKQTNVSSWEVNDFVNLEPSLTLEKRLGGHWVMGHIDSCASIKSFVHLEDGRKTTLSLNKNLMKYCVTKGSITVNGISLTIARVDDSTSTIDIALIPITLEETNLGTARVGDLLNIEVDILGKYIERLGLKD